MKIIAAEEKGIVIILSVVKLDSEKQELRVYKKCPF